MFIPFTLLYAEIHYRFKFLIPKYYQKEPEIITDIPKRVCRNITDSLPVLIIIKDSDKFPIYLQEIDVLVQSDDKKINKSFLIDLDINSNYFSKIFKVKLDKFTTEQSLKVRITIYFRCNNKNKVIINDNYIGLGKKDYKFYFAEESLPCPTGWFPGEPHYHSNYTSDQVEFGADVESAKVMAKNLGLKWLFVTDHSYDLDDKENNYLLKDPLLTKWKTLQAEIKQADSPDLRIIPGEEVSIGNLKNENVHLLAINHQDFIPGDGDSAEKWFKNKPSENLSLIKHKHSSDNLFIAAHPSEDVSIFQKITLRRGNWYIKDYQNSKIRFLQIINCSSLPKIHKNLEYWKSLLLSGYKFMILAGNDAHGNFNISRQIKIPFLKLYAASTQIFGNFFTVFKSQKNEPIKGIKNGKVIISNGPFINFWLKTAAQKIEIGQTTTPKQVNFFYEFKTSPEFGEVRNINVHVGNLTTKSEKVKNYQNGELIDLTGQTYLRLSLYTKKGCMAFTNPIWVD